MPYLKLAALALALFPLADPAHAGCGTETQPCMLAEGQYEIELPAKHNGPIPAVMFVHGYGSSGAGTMSNRGMIDTLLARGYAVIAPDGMPMDGRQGRDWTFPIWPGQRDDIAFLEHVRDDAAARFLLDKTRMLLAGFSVGGSMVTYLACADPTAFPAYAPISGGFWRPHPDKCAGPVRLLHTHGWTDTTVPLEGRILHTEETGDVSQTIAQGDIFHTMEIWRAANGCDQYRADKFDVSGYFWRRSWQRCTPGSALELALFPGDHMIPKGWADMALDWFEALQTPPG